MDQKPNVHHINNCKNHKWMTKLVDSSIIGTGYLLVSQYLPIRGLLLIRGNSVTILEQPGTHHLKINVISNVTNQHHVPFDMMCWSGDSITSMVFLPIMHNTNLTIRKYHINPWETLYKSGQYLSKGLRLQKTNDWGRVPD